MLSVSSEVINNKLETTLNLLDIKDGINFKFNDMLPDSMKNDVVIQGMSSCADLFFKWTNNRIKYWNRR